MRREFYRYASAMPAGNGAEQTIDMLIEMAAAYEKTSYKGLFSLCQVHRYTAENMRYTNGEADTAGENDDVVRIMTIRARSKGNSGVSCSVTFPGLARGFNTQDTKSDLVIHEKSWVLVWWKKQKAQGQRDHH